MDITVLGAGREVGRSAVLLTWENGESGVLLDYGIAFDDQDKPVFPLHIAPTRLKAILITHAHLDHIGATPFLYISARPLTIATKLTLVTGKLMIEDMIRLSGYYLPYEYPELVTMLDNSKAIDIGEIAEINGIQVEALNAGHIPGSSMFRVFVKNKTVLYTGDVNTIDTRLVKGVTLSGVEANVMVMECTYGLFNHPPRGRVEEKFVEILKTVLEEGGNVLIPSFSLGRAQEILALLAEKMPYASVYYDGMARDIMTVYLEYDKYINKVNLLKKAYTIFSAVKDSQMRKKICSEPGNIIVAPAGMLKGGPAAYYVKRLGFNPRNAIVLVSFQSPTTPGRSLLVNGTLAEGEQMIKAKVFWFDFSSHAGSDDLLNIVKSVKGLEKLFFNDAATTEIYTLGYKVKEELGIDFYAPINGEKISL
ncbi:MAG: MBL fold metallo-hydrolase [Ignisphaera sp.]